MSLEVQNRGISGPTRRTLCPAKTLKKTTSKPFSNIAANFFLQIYGTFYLKKTSLLVSRILLTSMHPSRMGTAHLLTYPGMGDCFQGGGLRNQRGLPGGSAQLGVGGCASGGGLPVRGVNPGGYASYGGVGQTPRWTEGMTHACENVTLPQTSFAGGNK